MYQIVNKKVLNPTVTMMDIKAPLVAKKAQPGQFIILRVDEDGERIPLTIADFDRERETITIIYQIVGYSTRELAKLKEGDCLTNFAGPLGVPTTLHEHKHVIGIAGGVGSAPLYPQLRALSQMGVKCDVIIGGRDEQYVILADKFAKFCDHVYITTDNGSLGEKGFVTTKLQSLIDNG